MRAAFGLRDAARDAGLEFYQTGVPCKKGHMAPRYVRDTDCIVCRAGYRADEHAKRARLFGAPGRFTGQLVIDLLSFQGGRCAKCGTEVWASYHIDHVVPLSKGGPNWPSNLQILCGSCNCSKCAKLEERYELSR